MKVDAFWYCMVWWCCGIISTNKQKGGIIIPNTITKKYYIYRAEPKDTSCDRCLENDRRIFEYYANDNKGRYYMRVYTNNTNTWLVYSNDGFIFYTFDNGKKFNLASVKDNFLDLLNEVELIYSIKDYDSKYYEIID